MFSGKESSNRIELSQLVQDLLNFGVLGSLRLWGGGQVGGGGHLGAWGVSPHTHACGCMDIHTCTFIHVKKLQMATNMEASMFSMFSMLNMHVCACMCMCMHACIGHPLIHPYLPPPKVTHPPLPQGCGLSESLKI